MIKQAIIPLAGLGTRMLPLTTVMPKELMPINGKPNLEYILDECIDAGIKDFIFIISKSKLSIKRYFFNDSFYKKIIKKKKDKRIINEFQKIKRYQKMIKFVYQNNPKGTGDAVLRCKRYIKDKYFLMLLPDDLIIKKNCSKEMINLHKKVKGSVIATKKVKKETVSRWGILSIKNKKKDYFEIKPGQGGEVHITDAIKNLIFKNNKFYGNIFKGKYLDCGTISGYVNSSILIHREKK